MRELNYGKGYVYAHDEKEGTAADMDCLPPGLRNRKYYVPSERGMEADIKRRLERREELKRRDPQPKTQDP
jgi:putative ATPase